MFNTPGYAKKTEKLKHVPASDLQGNGLTKCRDTDQSKRVSHTIFKLGSRRGYEKQENSRSKENSMLRVQERWSKSSGTAYESSKMFDWSYFLEDGMNFVLNISHDSKGGEVRDHLHIYN